MSVAASSVRVLSQQAVNLADNHLRSGPRLPPASLRVLPATEKGRNPSMRYEMDFLDLGEYTHFADVIEKDARLLLINTQDVPVSDDEEAAALRLAVSRMVQLVLKTKPMDKPDAAAS